ncbi:MAG: sigma-70 family RNA polymerase sigma factor [Propionibacteriaceae bacterium]
MSTLPRTRTSEGINGKDSVGLYLDAIARTPLLTAAEEVALSRRIEAGLFAQALLDKELPVKYRGRGAKKATDEELEIIAADGRAAHQQFLQANLRLVVSVARKYGRNSGMPILDLVQEGNTGLIRAVEKFDYAKGFKFSTYATWWIRQSITRGIAQQAHIVRLPVHVAEQVNQVAATRRTLELRLGREATNQEIADELGLTEQNVNDLIRFGKDHVSLDAPVEENGDTSLGDLIARELTPGPDDVVMAAGERERLEDMLCDLDERSADVVRRRYGLLDGRQAKLQDIGAVWGISAERVRQIERHAIARLRGQHALAA